MSGRWTVRRWRSVASGPYKWLATQPGHADIELHGPACDCYPFRSWRAAFDYADRMARADR